jgi:uncharacterized membrane protein
MNCLFCLLLPLLRLAEHTGIRSRADNVIWLGARL